MDRSLRSILTNIGREEHCAFIPHILKGKTFKRFNNFSLFITHTLYSLGTVIVASLAAENPSEDTLIMTFILINLIGFLINLLLQFFTENLEKSPQIRGLAPRLTKSQYFFPRILLFLLITSQILSIFLFALSEKGTEALNAKYHMDPYLSALGVLTIFLNNKNIKKDVYCLISFSALGPLLELGLKLYLIQISEYSQTFWIGVNCWNALALCVLGVSIVVFFTKSLKERRSSKILSKMFFEIPFGVLVFDEKDKIIFANSKILHFIQALDSSEQPSIDLILKKKLQYLNFHSYIKSKNLSLPRRTWISNTDHSYTVDRTISLNDALHDPKLLAGRELRFYTVLDFQEGKNISNSPRNKGKSSPTGTSSPELHRSEAPFSIFQDDEENLGTIATTTNETAISERKKSLEVTLKRIFLDSSSLTIMCFKDITTAKALGEESNGKNFKTNILNTFSHELRTPLNESQTLLAMAAKDFDIPKELKSKFLVQPLNSLTLMSHRVQDIIDYLKIDIDQIVPKVEYFSVREVLREVISLIEPRASEKKLELRQYIDPEVYSEVRTDRDRLTRVILNFLLNCLSNTTKGFVEVSLRQSSEPEHLLISIADSRFLSDEIIESHTDDLSNLHNYHAPDERDFGIFINMHHLQSLLSDNGDVKSTLTSNGALFKINIATTVSNSTANTYLLLNPIYKTQKYVNSLDEGLAAMRPIELSTRKNELSKQLTCRTTPQRSKLWSKDCCQVLLVDDDTFNLTSLEMLFNKKNIKCVKAISGKVALEAAVEMNSEHSLCTRDGCGGGIVCAFMDLNMPVMDGFETTQQLRNLMSEGKIKEFPIIACSANDSKEDLERVALVGMKGHLSKPVTSRSLDETLRYLKEDLKVNFSKLQL